MWTVPTGWASALTGSHAIETRVEAWRSGVYLGTVDAAADNITITVTARNRIRRTLNLTVPEALWPTDAAGTLSPYSTELRVYAGVAGLDPIPVFRGRIQELEYTYLSGQIRVSALDRMADINDDQFETPRAAPTGATIVATIAALIIETLPDTSVVDLTGSPAPIPSGLLWDRDRGKAIDDLAQAVGAEVVCLPDGSFTIRPVPIIGDTTPAWALTDGANGTVVSDVRRQSREGVANSVVVLIELANGSAPLRVVVHDTNPGSPTVYAGPFGKVTRFYSSPLITSNEQAEAAGLAILARTIGITRQRTVTCVPNPALDAGDVITVTVGGGTETHIADEFTLPLHPGPAMTITTRSSRADGELA